VAVNVVGRADDARPNIPDGFAVRRA
jgi:hypothetical protein